MEVALGSLGVGFCFAAEVDGCFVGDILKKILSGVLC